MRKTIGLVLLAVLSCIQVLYAAEGVEKSYDARIENKSLRKRFEIDSRMIDLTRRGIFYETDPRTRELSDFMLNAMLDFSAVQIYDNPMLKNLENGYRGVTFFGRDDGKLYSVKSIEGTYATTEIVEFGDMVAEFAVLKNENSLIGGRSFDGDIRFKTQTGAFSHRDIGDAIAENLRIVDPRNIPRMAAPETGLFTDVNGYARNVLNEYARMFPTAMRYMDRYSEMHNRIAVVGQDDLTFTHITFRGSLDYDALEKDYPLMARHLDKIRRLLKTAKIDFKTLSGNSLLTIELSGVDNLLTFVLCTRDGQFIPRDSRDKPVFEEAVSPTTDQYDFTVEVKLASQVYGLTVDTDNIIATGQYRATEAGGTLGFRLITAPRTRVSDTFLYVIPAWMINVAKPVFLDRLINDLGQVLVHGNKGRGTVLEIRSDTTDKDKVNAFVFASGEVLDNFFIRLGMRLARSRLIADPETDREFRRFAATGLGLLAEDMQAAIAYIDAESTK